MLRFDWPPTCHLFVRLTVLPSTSRGLLILGSYDPANVPPRTPNQHTPSAQIECGTRYLQSFSASPGDLSSPLTQRQKPGILLSQPTAVSRSFSGHRFQPTAAAVPDLSRGSPSRRWGCRGVCPGEGLFSKRQRGETGSESQGPWSFGLKSKTQYHTDIYF